MEKVLFDDIIEFKKKSTIKAGNGLALHKGNYPFYTSSNTLSKSINEFLFEGESLIFGTGGQASIHFCSEKFAVSTDCFVTQIKNPEEWSTKFIYHFLSGNIHLLENGFKGAGLKHISKEYLKNISIPKLPLHTQKTIAAKLDKAKEIIAYNQQLLEKYDQLTQALFIDMFGDPTSGKMKYAETELINLVANKFDIKCGPFGTQLSKSEYVLNGVPVWGIPQINSNFIKKPTEYVTLSKAEYLEQYSVVPNDIVMSRKGNVGKCAIYPKWENGILHSDALRIRCDKNKISPIFLVWQFRISRSLAVQISDVSHGAIMPGINVTKLKQIKPFVPPIHLQNQFAERVEKIEIQKQLAQDSLTKSEQLFQSLLKESFS